MSGTFTTRLRFFQTVLTQNTPDGTQFLCGITVLIRVERTPIPGINDTQTRIMRHTQTLLMDLPTHFIILGIDGRITTDTCLAHIIRTTTHRVVVSFLLSVRYAILIDKYRIVFVCGKMSRVELS